MYNIFTDNISSVRYYLKRARYLNDFHNPDIPPYRHLKALLVKIKRTVPLFQFMYSNIFIEDLKMLQRMEHKYILDKNVSDTDRVKVAQVTERLTELIQQILVNRAFTKYILWKNRSQVKELGKILGINTGQLNMSEAEEEDINEEYK